jgi:hypothetical protein
VDKLPFFDYNYHFLNYYLKEINVDKKNGHLLEKMGVVEIKY